MNKTTKGFIIGLLFGICLMLTTSSLASSIKEFVLNKAEYPIFV